VRGRTVGLLEPLVDPGVRAGIADVLAAALAGPDDLLADYAAVPAGAGIVGLILGPGTLLTAAHVERLPDLRVVASTSTGFDHIAVGAVTARGAWVTNVVDYCTDEVADHALALMLDLLRGVSQADRLVRRGHWASQATGARRIAGTALGTVGFGRIAQAVACRAVALGMHVSAFDPGRRLQDFDRLGVRRCTSLGELLASADIVSLHAPLAEDTRGLIDSAALAATRRGAFLVNVARGGLVDQQALVAALESGQLAGAALDVLETEPPADSDPLLSQDRVVITPHIAWESPASRRVVFIRAARCVAAVLTGREPDDVVGRPDSRAALR